MNEMYRMILCNLAIFTSCTAEDAYSTAGSLYGTVTISRPLEGNDTQKAISL